MSDVKKIYRVSPEKRIYSQKLDKFFEAGEAVDLSHASDAQISALLELGVIVETEKEVKHGKINSH